MSNDEWTIEKLNKMRARAICSIVEEEDPDAFTCGFIDENGNPKPNWEGHIWESIELRVLDELSGISTQALLDVLNGKAVIVPIEPTREMYDAARAWALTHYSEAQGTDGSEGCTNRWFRLHLI